MTRFSLCYISLYLAYKNKGKITYTFAYIPLHTQISVELSADYCKRSTDVSTVLNQQARHKTSVYNFRLISTNINQCREVSVIFFIIPKV